MTGPTDDDEGPGAIVAELDHANVLKLCALAFKMRFACVRTLYIFEIVRGRFAATSFPNL